MVSATTIKLDSDGNGSHLVELENAHCAVPEVAASVKRLIPCLVRPVILRRCLAQSTILPSTVPAIPHFCRRRYATSPVADRAEKLPTSASNGVSEPYQLVENDLALIYSDIKSELNCDLPELVELAQYYFSTHGKAFRPMIALLMAAVCGKHRGGLPQNVVQKQRKVAVIVEMIHTASLIHDDVIDEAATRRNQPSLHKVWGEKKAILTGDYILSVASRELARLRNPEVIICLSQIIEDLVKGELMQLGSKDPAATGRLATYLSKTYHKTASLMANGCKAVAILGGCTPELVERSFLFGKNLGMAFQLVDDNLDFISSAEEMGKPTSVDMELGLATAPVLFAAEKASDLDALIARRFRGPGDVLKAKQSVMEHGGVEQTKMLAASYSQEAVSQLSAFAESEEREALVKLADMVLDRTK
ncbi:Decaprenyl-diphosphate synthase subunit 1 [Hypsibius exemplaris]|uniref:Decaprenyl-diphosphate synthase subunit 1 n=1 Tax=Hypsibius exemplaris TaxID=2072580 RepID=A0A9X6NCU1_HYPEX|nr:Decaprenyl-diphosphate synthase subunit 1 [Hypsibius exemplaris]